MEDEIKKLIALYELKIEGVEKLLDTVQERTREVRRAKNEGCESKFDLHSLQKERAHLAAQKNAYAQAIADFDSLLDHV